MTRFIQIKLGLLFVPACLLVATSASAESGECRQDSDCTDGQFCQKATYVDGCAPTPDEPASECNTEPQVAEVGTCITPPTPCDDDDDCDEYLSCVDSGSAGDCAVDSEGNTYCSDVAEPETKHCGIASSACETNEDCPREFECVAAEHCFVDCAEGATECACPEARSKSCQPKQIDCEGPADCPSGWSCFAATTQSCQGGGAEGSAPGSTEGEGPSTDPVAPEDETCTEEPSVGSCYPDAWNGEVVYAQDGIAETGNGNDNGAGSTNDPAPGEATGARTGGGCSVARGPGQPTAVWALGLLFAWPLLRRRRVA